MKDANERIRKLQTGWQCIRKMKNEIDEEFTEACGESSV